MRTIIRLGVLAGLLVALLTACTNRGTNAPAGQNLPFWSFVNGAGAIHVFSPEMRYQLKNPNELVQMSIYVPRAAWSPPEGQNLQVPTLVLLAPSAGDHLFFYNRGMLQLLEEMTASGEIDPMVVVTIPADQVFGGYFYANSYPGGMYDTMFSRTLFEYLDERFNILNTPETRGICGFGEGAYGAFRAAIKNPGYYRSVSAVDGPLDFDAGGSGGMLTLFQQAVAEQGFGPSKPFKDFDSAAVHPVSRLLIGAALAFSPNDTLLDDTVVVSVDRQGIESKIATIQQRWQILDSTTLIEKIVNDMPGIEGDNNGFDFHLPFTENGQPYAPVWNRWLDNNLETLYTQAGGTPLTGVGIWIATSPEAGMTFGEQTQSFITFLRAQGYAPTVFPYSGYEGLPAANGDEYVYDLLRHVLKFHSDQFAD